MEVKNCTYCGEQIATAAKKCKHCNEWLEEVNEKNNSKKIDKDKPADFWTRIISSIFLLGTGWILFKFGSWHLVLGKKISILLQYISSGSLEKRNLIWEENGIAFRFNDSFYGFAKNGHYFDSPLVQWIMLFISLGLFIWSIEMLLFGKYGDD